MGWLLSVQLSAQSAEDACLDLPEVVTDLSADELKFMLANDTLQIRPTELDTAEFVLIEKTENVLRYQQRYTRYPDRGMDYEIAVFEGEDESVVLVSRVSHSRGKFWQRDFQVFKFEDGELFGLAPAERYEMLKRSVRAIRAYSNSNYIVLVNLSPESGQGFEYVVYNSSDFSEVTRVPVKWISGVFM